MAKNYFTDEQVKSLVKSSMAWAENMQLSIRQLAEFKSIMNLAVEEAIVRVGTVECADVAEYSTEYWGILHEPVTLGEPLYSVKELDN